MGVRVTAIKQLLVTSSCLHLAYRRSLYIAPHHVVRRRTRSPGRGFSRGHTIEWGKFMLRGFFYTCVWKTVRNMFRTGESNSNSDPHLNDPESCGSLHAVRRSVLLRLWLVVFSDQTLFDSPDQSRQRNQLNISCILSSGLSLCKASILMAHTA